MIRLYAATAAVALLASPAGSDEPSARPAGPSPVFAEAKVWGARNETLALCTSSYKMVRLEVGDKSTDVQVLDSLSSMNVELDGKQAAAFGADGEPLKLGDVKTRLAKFAPVVVFQMVGEGKPDPYYLNLIKDGTVVIALGQPEFQQLSAAHAKGMPEGAATEKSMSRPHQAISMTNQQVERAGKTACGSRWLSRVAAERGRIARKPSRAKSTK